ncbi:winged helix-turn-helix domain-containing protein [Pedobacter nutrimenti]|jgi:DNA-binding transcriptional regulator YhcF (GntR family)|uniref:Substrate-binding family protein n=1 Tax=Pedobacter nutrimenti TaxID=1241337 RepID=A0A318U6Z4_9SPHI|nr:winged helix-turn-helix domain-containing protein [Pedobacter nutrimenti]PYF69474.1 substrate-binding family protein [Pedobacter nutrimenti]
MSLPPIPVHDSKPTETDARAGSAHRMKYLQLAEYINALIESNELRINDRLPSLNQLMEKLKISKETTLKGLNYLSEKGIIEAEYRKGYYVKKKAQYHPYRICLILDKMNVLRDRVYQSFLDAVKEHADVDVYFHNHNFKVFEKLVDENLGSYTHFVVTTFLHGHTAEVLNRIPAQKRVILDYREEGLKGEYTCIYQDYQTDIFESLGKLMPQLEKYSRLVLISPLEAFHAGEVIKGFEHFCKTEQKKYKIYHTVNESLCKKGDAYVTFSRYDQDDVAVIKLARKQGWKLGKDIGLISYNDTAVKEVLEDGITVISTDFNKMGEEAAKAILAREVVTMRDPAKVILRNSL